MADPSPILSRDRVLRLGYRLRWLYLGLVVFGAMVWWAQYFGQTGWLFWSDDWQALNPLLRFMDVAYFYWFGTHETWFSSGSGVEWIWGISLSDWMFSRAINGGAGWAWAAIGIALAGPILVGLGVVGYVGINRRRDRQLPAVKPLGWLSWSIAATAWGVVIATALLLILHYIGGLSWWSDYAYGLLSGQGGSPGWPRDLLIDLFEWPLHPLWLCVSAVLGGVGLMRFVVLHDERFWRMEKSCRWVMFSSATLLVLSISSYFTSLRFAFVEYWQIDVIKTATFFSSTALLWAAACRVWLLFRLVKYEKQRVAMMTESPVCFACEYDLSGSLRGGARRCPECGVAVPGEVVERFGAGSAAPGSGVVETEGAGVGE